MDTYLMFGNYSMAAVGKASAERKKKAIAVIEDLGGKIKADYFLLGEHDLVIVVEFPGTAEVMKASMALSELLGIAFTTATALSVDEFYRRFE